MNNFQNLVENGTRPKHALLAEVLESDIREMPPGTPIPAVTSLMERFEVSQGTVVHALRHLRMKGLVNRPTGKKRLIAAGKIANKESVLNILLLRPHWSSPDYDAMSFALLEEASRQRLHLETAYYGPVWRDDLTASVRSHDAVVMLPSSNDTPQLFSLIEESLTPSVMLWEQAPVDAMMSVREDDFVVGKTAAEYLFGLGHKKVATFLSEPAVAGMRDRLAGWEQACKTMTGSAPENLVIDCSVEPGKDAMIGSYEKLRRWLFQNQNRLPATAIFCLCWTGALGMLRALREVGIEVPRDVSILSHGGENRLCEFSNPALSVVQGNLSETARQALNLVKNACLGTPPDQTTILLSPAIIPRESTQKINSAR